MVTGGKNIANAVGATSSEGFLVHKHKAGALDVAFGAVMRDWARCPGPF